MIGNRKLRQLQKLFRLRFNVLDDSIILQSPQDARNFAAYALIGKAVTELPKLMNHPNDLIVSLDCLSQVDWLVRKTDDYSNKEVLGNIGEMKMNPADAIALAFKMAKVEL